MAEVTLKRLATYGSQKYIIEPTFHISNYTVLGSFVVVEGIIDVKRSSDLYILCGVSIPTFFKDGIWNFQLKKKDEGNLQIGDPDLGKCILLLHMVALILEGHELGHSACITYVSNKKSAKQISSRAECAKIGVSELHLYAGPDSEDILVKIQPLLRQNQIIDSIQIVDLKKIIESAKGLSQVVECSAEWWQFVRKTNVSFSLAQHEIKYGDIAKPQVLKYIVDVFLYRKREKYSLHWLL
ncbi:hypothetical protein V6N13_010067 [Hibiscus sabdariffa]